ncbi:MAG: alkaline shock response membrane anchor protein AmaP [Clostridiales bacterium]|nr:alkaline shock response membrane anchor protein AmaP [Clostridiales bacterium]HBM80160.1 alkaline shock response membrane anchor protein AmaP [Clostridiaceae bacterium]
MNIFSRIILSIYMLVMIFVSICIVLLPFNLIPIRSISNYIGGNIYNNWYISLIGLLLLAVSVELLLSMTKGGNHSSRGIIKPAENGDIKISVETFESLALRAVKQISGIRDVKVRVLLREDGISVLVKLLIMPDINIPNIVQEAQDKIKEYIESLTEVGVKDVVVDVDNIASVTVARVQ